MELDRSLVGSATAPFVVEVEKGAIRAFADAIGDDNRLARDEDFARSKGYGGLVAPPTFPASFRPPERQPWLLGLDEGRILAGEQYFKYARPVVSGDVLTCRLHFVRVDEKAGRSGAMLLVVQELRAADAHGDLVVANGRVVIYRAAGRLPAA
ncbi:FAS1-like dehydratase domain-containing protein [Pollutimonas bauzanensis]|uniref:Acyl dehydratase n=1 Tax=Pollutimonas bauzanensis TaxID=658167 RepID=A0A1M5TK83_9BURK|nr:MaoC family dehydratase N-terminal domain-containing protein [Pollutimonas bauzanensis]SHH51182.1 Acyl dehydratase [Pollutimonas bauzanensis]